MKNGRSRVPAVVAGIVLAVLALGVSLYFYSASQEKERARHEAVLNEQQAERDREAAAEKERASRQAAEDQRSSEALKPPIQQEGTENGKPARALPVPENPARTTTPDNQDDQGTALANALGGASAQRGVSQGSGGNPTRSNASGSLQAYGREHTCACSKGRAGPKFQFLLILQAALPRSWPFRCRMPGRAPI